MHNMDCHKNTRSHHLLNKQACPTGHTGRKETKMWRKDIICKLQKIYDEECHTDNKQRLLHDYLMFYGMTNEIGNPTYAVSFESVIQMMSGKKSNPFLWIDYIGTLDGESNKTIYARD